MGANSPAQLTTVQRDRACGVLLGIAAGDALSAPKRMSASKRGEWANDTAMAIAAAELAAIGADLRRSMVLDRIVERWTWWARTVKGDGRHSPSLTSAAAVALAYLDDEEALIAAAQAISDLTHDAPDAQDACVLWCAAIRHAVLTGHLDVRNGLSFLAAERRRQWVERLDAADRLPSSAFAARGGVVAALQGAWSAIVHTPVPVEDPAREVFRVDHLRLALDAAVRDGGSRKVAAIAGGLLGAAYGASAVPSAWRLALRGWPGLRTRNLIQLADNIIDMGEAADLPWRRDTWEQPPPRRHPYDEQVWSGGVKPLTWPCQPLARPLRHIPDGVDAIVSLCPVANRYLQTSATHLDARLSDEEGQTANLDFVLLDTVRAIEQLRAEGRTVFLHSLHGTSRAPAVAALYGARKLGIGVEEALRDVIELWPDADPNSDLRGSLRRLAGVS